MLRSCLASSGLMLGLLVSGTTSAQVLGNSGDAVFGAERLFGIRGERLELDRESPLPDTELDTTTISLGIANPALSQNLPRLAFDYLVARKFSVGGAVGYSSSSFDREGPGADALLEGETTTFLIAGRVGFLHMFGRVLGIWPRGGVTYRSTSVEDSYDASDFGLTLECQFPIVLAPHFGFMPGLTFDQSLTGTVDPEGNADEYDLEYRSIALQFGLFGWL